MDTSAENNNNNDNNDNNDNGMMMGVMMMIIVISICGCGREKREGVYVTAKLITIIMAITIIMMNDYENGQ